MKSATGNYLNVFDDSYSYSRPGRDVFVIFNEPNKTPTAEEVDALKLLIEEELYKDPTGESLTSAIEDSGLECVAFGVQVLAYGLEQPVKEKKIRRGRKPKHQK